MTNIMITHHIRRVLFRRTIEIKRPFGSNTTPTLFNEIINPSIFRLVNIDGGIR